MNRREFIRTAIATTTLVAVGAAGIFEIVSKADANSASERRQAQQLQLPPAGSATTRTSQVSSSSASSTQVSASSSQTSSASVPAGYFLVAQLSALSGKTSAYFTHPTHGSSILLSLNGEWKAFSAICTHRPCTVEFTNSELYCPCHGATFSAADGSVTQGPAQATLEEYGVVQQGGALYISDSIVN